LALSILASQETPTMNFKSINPFTEELVKEYAPITYNESQALLVGSRQAFLDWSTQSIYQRIIPIYNVSDILEEKAEEIAALISVEMGKPISEALGEVEKCIWLCNYYADNAPEFLSSKNIKTSAFNSYIAYNPLGTILGIMPWNYPLWQVMRMAVPAILAGNTVLLKHAPNVQGCAQLIEDIFIQATLPKGVYQNLVLETKHIEKLIASPIIGGVSITGSVSAGKSVAELAGKHLKKTVLELGGNNAFLVFKDADVRKSVELLFSGRLGNAGQSCIAPKRVLLSKEIALEFKTLLLDKIKQYIPTNPLDYTCNLGMIARKDLADKLEEQVKSAIAEGAKELTPFKREGNKVWPCILELNNPKNIAFTEEFFGPVIPIYTAASEAEMIEISNNSEYGLGVSMFSENPDRLVQYISQLNEGAVFINDIVKSDPRLPFGGIKNSGLGRELGQEGILEFTNHKTVVIR